VGTISRITWSPDGRTLASASPDKVIQLWDAETGELHRTLKGHSGEIYSVAWSPDGRTLASGSSDHTIRLWDAETGKLRQTIKGHSDVVNDIAWALNGRTLASGSDDNTVRLWDAETWTPSGILDEHSFSVNVVAWSPKDEQVLASGSNDIIHIHEIKSKKLTMTLQVGQGWVYDLAWDPPGRMLASASHRGTVLLWNPKTGRQMNVLEGHTDFCTSISFSADGRLLASKSSDNSVRLWNCGTWETIAVLDDGYCDWYSSLAFHPKEPVLATLGEDERVIRIWDLDLAVFLGAVPVTSSVHYTNAKIVLVGDTGVGKTGLGLVLTGQPFVPTESTHGRHVWTFDSREVDLTSGREETRETLLWDLAGQPGYRLIHQLHLNEVAVALVVFDARSETDPFAGVRHWDRALRQALRVQGDSALPMRKFLVAARADRGGVAVSQARIDALLRDLGYDGYLETSAKEGWNIAELAKAIRGGIEWEALPKVSSTELFQRIKAFLVKEKESGMLLSTAEDLYRTFRLC
jgi:WD40 repeat protein